MAAFQDLLQRIARSLEEARAERPGDDLRTRLGYGTGDDDEDEPALDAAAEPESEQEPETARRSAAAWQPVTARTPGTAPALQAPRAPAAMRPSAAYRMPSLDAFPEGRLASPAAPPRPHASSASPFSERIRARLRTADALREAFVVKEILDRPLGRRRPTRARERGSRELQEG